MFCFFYKFRIIAAILLSSSVLFSQFLTSHTFEFYTYFFYTSAFAVPFSCWIMQKMNFRLLQSLTAASAASSFFAAADSWCAFLLGLSCGFILQFCVHGTNTLFPRQNASSQGILLACAFLFTGPFFLMLIRQPALQNSMLAAAVTAGLFLFPAVPSPTSQTQPPLLPPVHFSRFRKPCFFTFSIAASLGIACTMYQDSLLPSADFSPAISPVFWASLLAGPLFTGWFIERRGIFSGCILLLFLCESPLLCLCLPHSTAVLLAGRVMLLIAAGGFPVILAVLTHYLYGPHHYERNLSTLVFCVPLGLMAALPFASFSGHREIPLEEPAVCLFFLLILGFFCIFFAWKQRFVILKNP